MSTALLSKSLVTLPEYQLFRGIDDDNQAENFTLYLNAAVDYIERYCGRSFISGSATEVFSGKYYQDAIGVYHNSYQAKHTPFTSAPQLEYRSTNTVWKAVTTDTDYDSTTGVIYFTNGGVFADGVNNYRVRFNYGYSRTTAPSDLKAAQMMIARSFEMESLHGGVTTTSNPDGSKSYTSNAPSKFVLSILNNYIYEE